MSLTFDVQDGNVLQLAWQKFVQPDAADDDDDDDDDRLYLCTVKISENNRVKKFSIDCFTYLLCGSADEH